MFAAALTLRFAPTVPWLSDLGLLAGIPTGSVPTWFTDDSTLMVLGLLALTELLAHKSDAARELLAGVDRWGKPLAALLAYLGVVSVTDQAFIQGGIADYGVAHAVIGLLVGGGTFLISAVNNRGAAGGERESGAGLRRSGVCQNRPQPPRLVNRLFTTLL